MWETPSGVDCGKALPGLKLSRAEALSHIICNLQSVIYITGGIDAEENISTVKNQTTPQTWFQEEDVNKGW